MAGIFKLSPIELVDGTTYPKAKAERLPEVTNLYTELELQYALLVNDMEWLQRMDDPIQKCSYQQVILEKWSIKLEDWNLIYMGERERYIRSKMSKILDEIKAQLDHPPA